LPKDPVVNDIVERIRSAIDTADLEEFADLLHPDVTWGPGDHSSSGCHNRREVLKWYRRARAAGRRGRVTEVVVGEGKLLVGLEVAERPEAFQQGEDTNRWQVLTLREGRVVDIRGFEDRDAAASSAGVRNA